VSARSAYLPLSTPHGTLLAVQTPVYQGGTVPATAAQRRAKFLGWVGLVELPDVVLAQALAAHTGMAVTFRYHDPSSDAAFHAGRVQRGAQSIVVDLHNGWTVHTFSVLPATGLFAHGRPGTLLLAGIALSLL